MERDSGSNAGAPRVAFQGEPGAFSEEALFGVFGETATGVPCRDFAGVADTVASSGAEFGVLPIENSVAGSVVGSYDVLAGGRVGIVHEIVLPIRHCLLALPNARIDQIRKVISHPVALAQCMTYLSRLESAEIMAVYDTAGAAREVAETGEPTTAAVAGRAAADRYGLEILAHDIQDRVDNQTRFFIVAPAGGKPLAEPTKTALIFETEHRPGALVEVLVPFAETGISLAKIESRPTDRPWHYRFFLELQADADAADTRTALDRARARARTLTLLGSFGSTPAA